MQLIFVKTADTNKHEILMYPVIFAQLILFYLSLVMIAHLPPLSLSQDFISIISIL